MARNLKLGHIGREARTMHCPSCKTPIQHTVCEIPYCPNAACWDQKGAHDWEVIPIIWQMEENRRSRAKSGEVLAQALRRNRP